MKAGYLVICLFAISTTELLSPTHKLNHYLGQIRL